MHRQILCGVYYGMMNHTENGRQDLVVISHAESDWKEGSYVKFLDDKGSGLYSRNIKKIDNAEIHFEHLTELKNFEQDYESEETKQGKGAKEKYSLKQKGQSTSLHISRDIADKYADFFKESFEKCIEKIKELSEEQV